jgi:hypothetical protein
MRRKVAAPRTVTTLEYRRCDHVDSVRRIGERIVRVPQFSLRFVTNRNEQSARAGLHFAVLDDVAVDDFDPWSAANADTSRIEQLGADRCEQIHRQSNRHELERLLASLDCARESSTGRVAADL